jgi:hypothetical protein
MTVKVETDFMVSCRECSKEFPNLRSRGSHAWRAHKLKAKDYYDKYEKFDDEGFCFACGNKTDWNRGTGKYRLTCDSDECIRRNKYIYGDFNCKECDKRFTTNRGLMTHVYQIHNTFEYHDKYLRTEDNGYCKECGNPTDVQICMRVRRSFQGFKTYCSDECHTIGRSKWVRESITKLWQNPEHQLKMSQLATNRVLDINSDFGGSIEGWDEMAKRKGKFNNKPVKAFGCNFRSKFEFYVARRLEKANIKYEFEPRVTLPDGKYCLPDFYLPEHKVFIELRPAKMVDEKLIHKIRTIKNTYDKEVVLCTNIAGAATFIKKLDESRPKLNPDTVWIFEDKAGVEKEIKDAFSINK